MINVLFVGQQIKEVLMLDNQTQVIVNNDKKINITPGISTLVDVMVELEINKNVAIAIDNQIIRQSRWHSTKLNGGEQLSIFAAIAGG